MDTREQPPTSPPALPGNDGKSHRPGKGASKWKTVWEKVGPGIVMASAHVGTSHLVQSTRAGADFGLQLLPFIIMANLVKYPVFEFTTRYAAATHTSIIRGYRIHSVWMVSVYFGIVLLVSVPLTSVVTLVTAGMMAFLFKIPDSFGLPWLSLCILLFNSVLLISGRYSLLDNLIKLVAVVLVVCIVVATVGCLIRGPMNTWPPPEPISEIFSTHLPFVISLMGNMPGPCETSAFNSLWTVEKKKEVMRRRNRKDSDANVVESLEASVRGTLCDFLFGYLVCALLAVCFNVVGAYVMFGSALGFPGNAALFARRLVELFESSLGPWARYVVAIATWATMFSTSLTVQDGYVRVLEECGNVLRVPPGGGAEGEDADDADVDSAASGIEEGGGEELEGGTVAAGAEEMREAERESSEDEDEDGEEERDLEFQQQRMEGGASLKLSGGVYKGRKVSPEAEAEAGPVIIGAVSSLRRSESGKKWKRNEEGEEEEKERAEEFGRVTRQSTMADLLQSSRLSRGPTASLKGGCGVFISKVSLVFTSLLQRFCTLYALLNLLLTGGCLLVLFFFGQDLKRLIDITTIILFFESPFVAAFNLMVTKWGREMPVSVRPGWFLVSLCIAGVLFMAAFAVMLVYVLATAA
uniref:Amino acid transporter transmembrane domain-containing protein n=1 Tax=Chromera velia CCMP2878 TaxID=1169474 RepID=A0A0G4IFM8_9ALVE|eukprot:Cvel_13968.t1-p1 / transcript=Cvel_13968.t1 / gene=Cvel_13968 / organism=Chromera_velia_CCMP2878 / gene_product=Uncharacterized protein PM0681, putative / transcript_product=Uncharacterized protein PM0681, putative / location=Cvel_scaffold976:16884-18797(-) / protein_length=638 / sequence_SO=supercontig / SO=protein_coding / is_pseudo=false